jgi:hypothetical protein
LRDEETHHTDKEIEIKEQMSFWIDEKANAHSFLTADNCELIGSTIPGSAQRTTMSNTSSIATMVRSLTPDRRLRVTLQRRLLAQVIARMPR